MAETFSLTLTKREGAHLLAAVTCAAEQGLLLIVNGDRDRKHIQIAAEAHELSVRLYEAMGERGFEVFAAAANAESLRRMLADLQADDEKAGETALVELDRIARRRR